MISCCCWRRDCSKKRMNEAGQTAWWEQPLVPRQLFATLVLEAEDPLLISQEPDGNNAREGRRNQGPAVSSCQWGWGIVIVMWWCQCVLIPTQPTHKQETRYLCQSPDPLWGCADEARPGWRWPPCWGWRWSAGSTSPSDTTISPTRWQPYGNINITSMVRLKSYPLDIPTCRYKLAHQDLDI